MFVQVLGVAIVFRRRRAALLWGAYVLCYLAGIVAVGFVVPWALLPIGVLVAGTTALGLGYGRDSYGIAEGLPHGRMPLVNIRAILDREYFVKRAERDGPVFKSRSPSMPSPTVCVVGLPRAVDLLREHEDHLVPVGHPFDALMSGRLLRHMQGNDHRYYRRILRDLFDGEILSQCQPDIEAIVADALGALSVASMRDEARGIEPHDALEIDLVLQVFLRLLLGLEPGSESARRPTELFVSIDQDMTGLPQARRFDTLEAATRELEGTIRQVGAVIRALIDEGTEPTPSFLSSLLRSHPDALDDPTVVSNLIFTFRGGAMDLGGLLHWIMKLLADNQVWLVALRETADPIELANRVVMESLRMEQSELLYRYVAEEINIDDSVIPAGWLLRICVRESHRDPEIFDEPRRFDPDRFTRQYSRTEYSPLGTLSHTCLGAGLVHAVASTFVRRLALDYDLSVVSDGRPVFAVHWRPSRRHRVVLRPRNPAPIP
jgi:cytochrome P450